MLEFLPLAAVSLASLVTDWMNVPLWGSSYAVLMSIVWEFESKANKLYNCTQKPISLYYFIHH